MTIAVVDIFGMAEKRTNQIFIFTLFSVILLTGPVISDAKAEDVAYAAGPSLTEDSHSLNSDYPGYRIANIARKHLGTPYKFGGLSPSTGFDCSGLTRYVYSNGGYSIPRNTHNQFDDLNPVVVPAPGDLIFFNINGNKVSHVGIYMGNFQFIHAPSTGKKVSYADIRNPYWKSRYAGSRSLFR